MTAVVVADDERGRARAIETLRAGGVVALPTDTVYGLAVALGPSVAPDRSVALDADAGIERLFLAKRRSPDKGIVLLLADAPQMDRVALVTPAAAALTEACWPGALTVILAQRPNVAFPAALTGGRTTIGLRVADHPAPRAFAAALGPLPTTSANLSGFPDALDAATVAAQLGDGIDLILDGGSAVGGTPSTVVDCSGERPRLLRAGAIATERLAAILDVAGVRHDLASVRGKMTDAQQGVGEP